MAMHFGKLWYMKKIKELIIEAGVEGLRYVKTLTYEKGSILRFSYSNVLMEIGHKGDGYSLCMRTKGFIDCKEDARLVYESDLGYWIDNADIFWKAQHLREESALHSDDHPMAKTTS